MAERPTEAELSQLYRKHGKDALVWYAWRNALRTLPMLGNRRLTTVWGVNTVKHVYALCRVNVLLAGRVNLSKGIADGAAAAADAASYARKYASRYASTFTKPNNSGVGKPYGARDADEKTTDAIYVVIAALATARAAATAINTADFTASADTAQAADADAARLDYEKLTNKGISDHDWLGLQLWKKRFLVIGGKPKQIERDEQLLLQQLEQLALGFLADDIKAVWEGRAISSKRLASYAKDLSDTVTNDPTALQKAILGEKATSEIHAVRCLLLGPGGAGKSSLADRLQDKKPDPAKRLTVGIDYLKHQSLDLKRISPEFELNDSNLDLFLWDFGGQTIFHGLHSAFLHENCVYVLVVDSRHEQAPDEWLYQIRYLAGLQAKVILVTNWYEQCETYQNEIRLLREFPDLLSPDSFFYFSCLDKEAEQFHKFIGFLIQTSLDSQKMVFKETLDVQKELQNQYQDDVFLDGDTLDEVIEETTGKSDITDNMASNLQQLGFLVRVDNDDQHFCLKPEWAIDHAYQLLYSPHLRNANGVLTLAELKQEFKDQAQVSKKYTGHLVSFLQERSLCQRLQNDAYFFPDAAPANEPETATQILQNQQGLIIRFDLPYLPLGFHARLVNHLFVPGNDVTIAGPADIWRQGFILRKGETKAVVHYLLRKNVIEMVLVGNLTDFSALLNTLYVNLKAVMTAGEGMHANQIHPSVKMHDEIFSVHSAEGLVRVLEGINDYGQLFDKVRAMAAKYNLKDSTLIVDSKVRDSLVGNNNQQNSNNITVTSDQREQIAVLADVLLGNAQNLQPNELAAVAEVKQALAEPEQEASKGLLGNIWQATTDLAGFGSNLAQLHQWGTQNSGLIAAAWAAGAALLP